MKKISGLVVLVVFVMVFATGVALALPINGGFETGDFTGWNTSAASGAYWQVVGTDNQGGYTTSPTEGQYMAKIYGGGYNSLNSNRLSQTFTVVNADTISFDYIFYAPDYPPYEQPGFKVVLAKGGITSTIFSVNDPGVGTQIFGWENFSYDLGGYSGVMKLDFYCGNTIDGILSPWAYIDSVNVNPVPEPASLLLFGSGLLGLAKIWRRKKSATV